MASIFDSNRLNPSALWQNLTDAINAPVQPLVEPPAYSEPASPDKFLSLNDLFSYGRDPNVAPRPQGRFKFGGQGVRDVWASGQPQRVLETMVGVPPAQRTPARDIPTASVTQSPVAVTPNTQAMSSAGNEGMFEPRLEAYRGIMEPGGIGSSKNMPKQAQPISIVRGLQTTEYLPTVDERGYVQYKAKRTPEEEMAQALQLAGLQKTQSEVVKNLRVPAIDQATLTRLADARKLQALATTTQDPTERKDAQAAYEEIIKSLVVKPGLLESMLASSLSSRTE
jgi:hypothetical protein